MLGKKIKFKLPKVPGKNFLKGKFVTLEPANPSKHGKDLFETFSLDKQGLLWKYMPDGPFKNINALCVRGLFYVYDLFSFYICHLPSILFHKLVACH